MNQEWKNRSKDPYYNAKLVHAKDAHNAGCWVYSEKTGTLYTPREFMESKEQVDIYRGKENQAAFRIVEPRLWLQNMMEQVNKMNKDIEILHKRITEHYDITPKPKNRQ